MGFVQAFPPSVFGPPFPNSKKHGSRCSRYGYIFSQSLVCGKCPGPRAAGCWMPSSVDIACWAAARPVRIRTKLVLLDLMTLYVGFLDLCSLVIWATFFFFNPL